jgi:hypothetical protein
VLPVSTKPLMALRRANSVAQAPRRILLISLVDLSVLHVLLDGIAVLLAMLHVYRVLTARALMGTQVPHLHQRACVMLVSQGQSQLHPTSATAATLVKVDNSVLVPDMRVNLALLAILRLHPQTTAYRVVKAPARMRVHHLASMHPI